jgi:DNA invertase Pin-like site-specific DNA recombinase
MAATKKLIPYYRVSTKRQEESGLGLEAQQIAVASFQRAFGGEVVKEFQEAETGKIAERPELQKAIALAKRLKATLVVAKLDRLARNVLFTATLMESGVDFVACDNPSANKLTIHILAAVAEDEARRISERTTSALAAFVENRRVPKRVREMYPEGVPAEIEQELAGKLGSSRPGAPKLTYEQTLMGVAKAAANRRALSKDIYDEVRPIASSLRSQGLSLREIAARLDEEGHTTVHGKAWTAMQVSRLLAA